MRRNVRRRGPLPGVLAGLTLGWLAFGAWADTEFRASNGAVVPAPAIDSLDCSGMEDTLTTLDRSEYRSAAPLPEGHPDREIFDYENELARETYDRCIAPETQLQDAGDVFQRGFED